MIGLLSTEEELQQALKELNRANSYGDYNASLKAIEKAIDLCNELKYETRDYKKKKLMDENLVSLENMKNDCLKALNGGIKEKVEVTPKNNNYQKEPQKEIKKEETKEVENNDEINYVFNGVDVKSLLIEDANDTTMFSDVIGMEDEKDIIETEFFLGEVGEAFKKSMKMKDKKFILLYGVPGTGKTFFAKAISNELKARNEGKDAVPFFNVVGGQLKGSYHGETEHNINALFEFCKQFKRCVLFIDEFDTLVPDRGKLKGDTVNASTVTTFLQALDGFASDSGTLLIAATNCPYNIDGGVLSRAKIQIEVPLPVKEVILKTLERKIGEFVSSDVDLDLVAENLDGYSNRDVGSFIECLQTLLMKEFKKEYKEGIRKDFSLYKITNEMISEAFKKTPSSITENDLILIEEYKNRKNH